MIIKPIRTGDRDSALGMARYNEHGQLPEELEARAALGEHYKSKGVLVFSNKISGTDYKDIAFEMDGVTDGYFDQNPKSKLKKPYYSCVISFDEGDQVDGDMLEDIIKGYAEYMGFSEHQYAVWEHNDRSHRHFHMLLNRIHPENESIWSDEYSRTRGIEYAKFVETKYEKLRSVKRPNLKGGKIPKEDLNKKRNTGRSDHGTNSYLQEIKWKISKCLDDSNDMDSFKRMLAEHQLEIKAGFGMVFTDQQTGKSFNYKQLGEEFSRKQILEYLSSKKVENSEEQIKSERDVLQNPYYNELRYRILRSLKTATTFEDFKKNLVFYDMDIKSDRGLTFVDVNTGRSFNYKLLGEEFSKEQIVKILESNREVEVENRKEEKLIKEGSFYQVIEKEYLAYLQASDSIEDFRKILEENQIDLLETHKNYVYFDHKRNRRINTFKIRKVGTKAIHLHFRNKLNEKVIKALHLSANKSHFISLLKLQQITITKEFPFSFSTPPGITFSPEAKVQDIMRDKFIQSTGMAPVSSPTAPEASLNDSSAPGSTGRRPWETEEEAERRRKRRGRK